MVLLGEIFWVEVAATAFPVVGGFHEDGGNKANAAFFVGKDGDDFGAAADLLVQVLEHVGGSEAAAHRFGEAEDGEAFG